ALIPGTNTPITIDNVNDGVNNQYYVDNQNGGADGVVYDGYTVTLTALAEVVCGETYHLKFAIADAGDSSFDSGVFLEARSFNSNAVSVNIETASGSVEDGGGWIVEGCTPADITFTRPAAAADSTDAIPVYISGSAINGTDYTGIPDTVFFAIGDTSVSVTIEATDDILNEVGDSIVITVYSLNLCGDTIVSTGTIQIYDAGFYSYETEITGESVVECAGDSVLLVASSTLGNPIYDYDWNNFLTGDSIWIQPSADTILVVETEDACGTEALPDTFLIQYLVNPDPTVNISGPTDFNCVPQSVNLSASGSLGNTPYVYLWNTGSGSANISPTLTSDTLFSVIAIDQCGVQSEPDTIYINQNPVAVPNIQTSLDVTLDCPGDMATLTAIASGGVQPYEYNWSVTNETTSTIDVQPSTTTEYVITVTDDCFEGEVTDTILVTVEPYVALSISLSDTTVMCPGDAVMLEALVSGGNDPINVSWSDSNTGYTNGFNANTTTTLTVTASDDCGNSINDDVTVNVPNLDALTSSILNADLLFGDTVIVCEVWSDTLTSAVSGGLPPYTYQWN
ncbi:MAG: choice-of-anchor L domain-containing protein, partial [Flavobacteriales bacterium]